MAKNDKSKEKKPSNLELTALRFGNLTGANELSKHPTTYGTNGEEIAGPAYRAALNSENMIEFKKQLQKQRDQEDERYHIAGQSESISDQEASRTAIKQTYEVMSMSKLGDVYNVVKQIAGELNFEIPEQLKDKIYVEVEQKIKKQALENGGKIDPSKISKDDQNIINMYETLTNIYRKANARNILISGFLIEENERGKSIQDYYKPKPENPESQETPQEQK